MGVGRASPGPCKVDPNPSHTEVEIRALVSDMRDVSHALVAIGARKVRGVVIHDYYFCPADVTRWEEIGRAHV